MVWVCWYFPPNCHEFVPCVCRNEAWQRCLENIKKTPFASLFSSQTPVGLRRYDSSLRSPLRPSSRLYSSLDLSSSLDNPFHFLFCNFFVLFYYFFYFCINHFSYWLSSSFLQDSIWKLPRVVWCSLMF